MSATLQPLQPIQLVTMPDSSDNPDASDPASVPSPDGYVPGACNIGPWEIRRRRIFAVAGIGAGVALSAALLATGASPAARLVVLLPFWGGVFSWLQARRRFCAAFAFAGVANFGRDDAGRTTVQDPASRRADLQAVWRLTRDSFLVALAIAAVVVLIPR
jgi:hypothetical protein